MKAVCCTSDANPSQRLIKQICYPDSFLFQSRQTALGCSHKILARSQYERNLHIIVREIDAVIIFQGSLLVFYHLHAHLHSDRDLYPDSGFHPDSGLSQPCY